MEVVLFAVLAFVAILAALLVVAHRHPVYSALSLVVTMLCIAFLFLLLRAEFLWVMQITVYAGAVMVLFLFVIMLLDLRREERPWHLPEGRLQVGLGVLLALALLAELAVVAVAVAVRAPASAGAFPPAVVAARGNAQLLGRLLYTEYVLPFELTSVILLVAIVGAIVMAKKRFE
jgi:NADH-quinone oxidoreductase subunit J